MEDCGAQIAELFNGTYEFPGVVVFKIFDIFIIFGYANGPLGWDLYANEEAYQTGKQPTDSGEMKVVDATLATQANYVRAVIEKLVRDVETVRLTLKHKIFKDVLCPKCGDTSLDIDFQYCPYCGIRLEWSADLLKVMEVK